MAMTAEPTVGRLGRSQAARRTRVLDAVLELAHEGGYDAIQLRAVAERSGVASDTIYRYFGSRDRMISDALVRWLDERWFTAARTWGEGATAAERVLAFSRHVCEMWGEEPNLVEALVRSELTEGSRPDGPGARAREFLEPLLRATLDGVDPEYAEDIVLMLGHLTHSTMTFLVRGQMTVAEIHPIFERTVRRLAQHPAMDGHRPKAWDPKRR